MVNMKTSCLITEAVMIGCYYVETPTFQNLKKNSHAYTKWIVLLTKPYYFQPSPERLFLPVIGRLLFIPFFLLCNYRPSGVERLWPVLFHWDGLYWLGAVLFALSGGYTASLALMYCPR